MGCVGWIHGQAGGGVVTQRNWEIGEIGEIGENVSLLVSICRANINLKRLGWMVVGVSCFYGVFYLY